MQTHLDPRWILGYRSNIRSTALLCIHSRLNYEPNDRSNNGRFIRGNDRSNKSRSNGRSSDRSIGKVQ